MPGVHVNKRAPGYQSERGERQQVRVLDALTDGPSTSFRLADQLHMSRQTVHKYLRRLMQQPNRRIYVCGYESEKGRPTFVYDIGNKRNVTLARHQMGRILAVLEQSETPIGIRQVGARIGVSVETARRYMRTLKKKEKIHVVKWVWASTAPLGLYVAGPGEDAPKLKKRPVVTRLTPRSGIFAALGL